MTPNPIFMRDIAYFDLLRFFALCAFESSNMSFTLTAPLSKIIASPAVHNEACIFFYPFMDACKNMNINIYIYTQR